jgi:hypothetical protein
VIPLVLLLALAAKQAPLAGAAAVRDVGPGRVVLVGEGAVLDAAACADLGADRRVLLIVGDPSRAIDPMDAAGAPVGRIELDASRPYVGDDRKTAEAVRGATCVVLTGGAYLDWFGVVNPAGTTTRLSDSIHAAHRGGATIVGVGAAAPYLAKWAMVERAALSRPERNPRRRREDVAVEGLGLLPKFLVETSARERSDPARLLRAVFDGGLQRAIFLDGATIVVADPARKSARILGGGRTVLFDLGDARRNREAWIGGRLSLLGDGDRWTEREGAWCAPEDDPVRLDADPSLERLRRSFDSVSAEFTLRSDESTSAAGACHIAFDLAWRKRGS